MGRLIKADVNLVIKVYVKTLIDMLLTSPYGALYPMIAPTLSYETIIMNVKSVLGTEQRTDCKSSLKFWEVRADKV
jgi:hypothetical protein